MSRLLYKSKKISARSAVTAALVIGVSFLWIVSMLILTIVYAQEIVNQLYFFQEDFNTDVSASDMEKLTAQKPEDTAYYNYRLHEVVDRANWVYLYGYKGQGLNITGDNFVSMKAAAMILDESGKTIAQSGDFVFFHYASQEQWEDGSANDFSVHDYGYFNIKKEDGASDTQLEEYYSGKHLDEALFKRIMKITGVIDEEGRITPYNLEFIAKKSITDALFKLGCISDSPSDTMPIDYYIDDGRIVTYQYDENGRREYDISELDRKGMLQWKSVMEHAETSAAEEPLQTFYAYNPLESLYSIGSSGGPVKYEGREFESMLDLTSKMARGKTGMNTSDLTHYRGGDSGFLHIGNSDIYKISGTFIFDKKYYVDGEAYYSKADVPSEGMQLQLVTGLYCNPLKEAARGLVEIYIVTAYICAGVAALIRYIILKNLIKPVENINRGRREGWAQVYLDGNDAAWSDTEELHINYTDERQYRKNIQNEITRLNTALDYAKEAEENRRQLTSSIAHELKTPLAIVRSYAEGLQEHIAEEKRDKYLEIIVSETDRMDAMVLEMLDLSRLEAGKVKLAQDDFSLTQMVQSTFEKFETLAAEKELTLTLDMKGDLPVTADEARLGQVVTNFVSNAVRYTPHGGEIRVRAYARGRETFFFIENTSKHFTEEEKEKIWETFYRTDKSRSSKGTGLGLAIAKNIVELHGGKDFVYNTELGVQFGFKI
ncbi:MAG: HAMP domain-containing histidine kinase [Firmicutes bacterium]|nr:HAMP domain-containing histidine kinase [Bacillota bacterium]